MPSLSGYASAKFWSDHPLNASPPTEEPKSLDKGKAIASRNTLNPAAQEFCPALDLTIDNRLTNRLFQCFIRLGADVSVMSLEAESMKILTPFRELHGWTEARTLSIKQQAIEQIMPYRKEYARMVRAGHLRQAEQQWAQLNGSQHWEPVYGLVREGQHQQQIPPGFVVGEVVEPKVPKGSDDGYESNEVTVALPAVIATIITPEPTTSPIIVAPQSLRPDPLLLERILQKILHCEGRRLGALEPTERCEPPSLWPALPPIGFERQLARKGPGLWQERWCIW